MTTTVQSEVAPYAEAVRRALADLAPAEVRALTDDLDEHLAEVRVEAGVSLDDLLGPPERYASELRASAGGTRARTDEPSAALSASTAPIGLDTEREDSAVEPRDGRPLPPPTPRAGLIGLGPPVAPTRPPDRLRPWQRSDLAARIARLVLVVAGVAVGAAVVRASQPLNTFQIVLATAAVVGFGLVARWLLRLAQLPDASKGRMTATILVVGAAGAVLLGSSSAGRQVIYIEPYGGPATTVQGAVIPEVVGLTSAEAASILAATGYSVSIVEVTGTGVAAGTVLSQEPASTAMMRVGSVVTLVVAADSAPETSADAGPAAATTTVVVRTVPAESAPTTVPSSPTGT